MTHSLFSLTGRVALVTGAAGHLGRAMSEALAEAGAKVYLNGRRVGPLEELRDSLRGRGLAAEIAPFDVGDEAALTAFMDGLGRSDGRLDVLINNAHSGRIGTIATATATDYADAHNLAVTAAGIAIQKATPLMQAAGQASVINIASMYGMVSPDPAIYGDSGFNNPPWYGAAKAGLLQLTRYAACHLAPLGIRVNAISPGAFPPASVATTLPEFHAKLCAKVPMRRTGAPEELKGIVVFLASDAASYVTGANIPVDGGWTAW
jgi:NAD(P)-dependent dehydrogenase (short-subunit alcohol dehydrogenase family)